MKIHSPHIHRTDHHIYTTPLVSHSHPAYISYSPDRSNIHKITHLTFSPPIFQNHHSFHSHNTLPNPRHNLYHPSILTYPPAPYFSYTLQLFSTPLPLQSPTNTQLQSTHQPTRLQQNSSQLLLTKPKVIPPAASPPTSDSGMPIYIYIEVTLGLVNGGPSALGRKPHPPNRCNKRLLSYVSTSSLLVVSSITKSRHTHQTHKWRN